MVKKLPFILLLIMISCGAQEKVKGSRNVKTEKFNLTPFHSIQIAGEFEVSIVKGSRPKLEIKADDNLIDLIQSEVIDGVLYIKPIKEISRAKSQKIQITFQDTLKSINISDKVELESEEDLYVEDFQLETKNKSKAFLSLTANSFNLIHGDDAKAELNVTAKESYFQLNQSSDVKALVNAPLFKVDIYEKASARIEGEIQDFDLRAGQSSKFDGEKLTAENATVLAQGRSDNKINVSEKLEISATGNSKTEIYNSPQINLTQFTDEAVIAKKESKKGLF
ncbi:hypothetical protein C7S20_12910 [Christiangramia fulva]|uniref:Putative auto-transporter adhesin head GIN domain-containing protein n=1 Tax=Christiangramia fulva TaxID=2126553 RepID=A0A2R3Z730_9FLAO|nr:DUF2807 domain-containing protein [Christiangramia fulva]AVR46081.1 hypothetical protein C7S20_12910 [Christiangramia fulva]